MRWAKTSLPGAFFLYRCIVRLSLLAAFLFLVGVAISTQPVSAQSTHPWTVKEIFGGPSLTGDAPEGISWSPDGARATYIAETGDLMEIQVADGSIKKLLPYEKIHALLNANISEKDRDHRARYKQPDYIWAPDSQHLLFDTNGELWIYDIKTGVGGQAGNSGMQSGDNPQFSPNGQYVSYLHDQNLYVQRMGQGGQPLALTNTRNNAILNGGIDWVYLEELNVRQNYFWSPDSRQLAYLQMDEAQVPQYPLTDWIPLHATVDLQRYPQPGDPNPGVRVGVVSTSGGSTRWLKIPLSDGNDYIPRFGWVNPRVVWVETLTRDHKHLNIYFADTRTGDVKLVLAQSEPKYFTMTYDVTFVGDHQFLALSWADGYTHMYRYSFDAANPLGNEARLSNQLEKGEYEVDSIKTVDEQTNTLHYISSEGDPREQQIWAIKLDGSDKHQVSRTKGFHEPEFPDRGTSYIDKYSDKLTPPTVAYCTADGLCKPFWQSTPLKGHTLIVPEDLQLTAADKTTALYGTLTLPPDTQSPASVPLIVNPYGGPGVGAAKNRWGNKRFLFDQLLAEHGFAVLHVDNRGMAGRGRDFEQACYHAFGPPQLADQLASVDQVLAKYPQLDAHRLGWWGWSWGGSFTLYALSHSDRFLAGVSGAPVTDFRNYDSIYTERYLGLPSENADSYRNDAALTNAAHLKGHILILHGTGDDNVHLSNTIQYIQKLIDAGIPYDYNVFPRKTHSVAGPTAQTALNNKLLMFFETYVKNAKLETQQ